MDRVELLKQLLQIEQAQMNVLNSSLTLQSHVEIVDVAIRQGRVSLLKELIIRESNEKTVPTITPDSIESETNN